MAKQAAKHGGPSRVGGSQSGSQSGEEVQRSAFWTAVWRSYLVILFLEIGDRCVRCASACVSTAGLAAGEHSTHLLLLAPASTFFIAALMSAKHPAMTVFVGAFGASGRGAASTLIVRPLLGRRLLPSAHLC